MAAAETPFMDYWASTVHPAIKDDFERLLGTTPKRIGEKKAKAEKSKKEKKEKADKAEKKDPSREKITLVCEEVKEKGERRNAYMNLAWTGPVDNTFLDEKITLGKVENMAADLFLRSLPTDGAAETAPESQADDAEAQPQSKAGRRAAETLSQTAKKPWQIPERVEKGFEIPIMIASSFSEPEIGKFKRLGMDVVVNAVWLAYFWAKQEGASDAVTALEELILDWPFDFIHIGGDSPEEIEENKFKWAVNMTARVERLRDFIGLQNTNLLRIVARAADFVRDRTAARGKASPEKVTQWLQENVTWGLLHCPDTRTVKRHMENWAALQKCPAAMDLMEAAMNRWGRDNLLDWPTKLGIIVQRTDATSLGYVVASLYTRMWRTGQKDPWASSALGDVISEILWAKTYVASFLRKFPEVLNSSCNSDASTTADTSAAASRFINHSSTVKSYLNDPLKFFLRTEGPDKDPTWLAALPNEPLRLAMKHCIDVAQGYYKPEIAGALKQPKSERYSAEQFHKGSRVAKRFFEPFQNAYDSLVAARKGCSETQKVCEEKVCDDSLAATANGATGIGEEVGSEDKKKTKVEQQITG
jgi:hypothetical protein